ncbi:unnamed protein product [Bursaphelenchus okinawaensis]|uniref:Choline transporter-like protein n=1 Tax=Bursaphelenchus okinawaensis TaxID=465554 RepID=A0A811LD94_9BILA|nr:unnamed protein product [Bursaphelenchus okinawaensis]CAG9123133.1 unnamed protein product [Bursaphelenchus okinawaensis]
MGRRTAAVSQKGSAPPLSEYYLPAEPVYNEIETVPHQTHQFPVVQKTTESQNFHGVVPKQLHGHHFVLTTQRPVVQPVVGQRAANFELRRAEKLLNKNPERAAKKPFNPIVLTRRGCTDVPFCMLFILYLFGWTFVAFIAYKYGKPERILHPTDSWGNSCGSNRPSVYETIDKPYLFFFDLTKCVSYATLLSGCPTFQMCVKKCPTKYWSYLSLNRASLWSQQSVKDNAFCDYTVDIDTIQNFSQLRDLVKAGKCAAYTVPSSVVLGRCVPEVIVEASNVFNENGTLNNLLANFGNEDNLVAPDSKISETQEVVKAIAQGDGRVLQNVVVDLGVSWWQILALLIMSAIVSFVWTLVMRLMGGFMIWMSILLLLLGLAGGTVFCYHKYQILIQDGAINDYSFQPIISVYFEMPNTWLAFGITLAVLLIIIFFGVLFIRSRVSLAVALIGETMRYHMGTLALGSMILSFVKMLQVILDFVYSKLKNVENPVGKAIYRALTCLFWCLEKVLRFLSKNAYIMTAVYGKGFCKSARDSFSLLSRNLVRVVVLNRVSAFLLFIGKALITCGMGALAFYYFTGQIRIDDLPQVNLHYYFVPVIIVVVGTYFICDLFFQVYDMGVDTTFLCFLEDSEANDGTTEKPFYMSDSLKRLLGKENKF